MNREKCALNTHFWLGEHSLMTETSGNELYRVGYSGLRVILLLWTRWRPNTSSEEMEVKNVPPHIPVFPVRKGFSTFLWTYVVSKVCMGSFATFSTMMMKCGGRLGL